MKRNLYYLVLCMLTSAIFQKAVAQTEVQTGKIAVVKINGLKDPARKKQSFVPLAKGVQAIYANLTNDAGGLVSNGGANSSTQGTRILADDINFAGTPPFKINLVLFSVTNSDASSFTARPRIRFWKNDGVGGGPGTLVAAYSFAAVPFAAFSATTLSASLGSGFTFPNTAAWVGIFFDAPLGATATVDNLNNLGQAVYDPPNVGTSADQYFVSSNAGFATNNPNGSIQSFGVGGPPVSANFGWTFQQSCDNEPTAFNITGGGLYCGSTGVAIGLDGSETGVNYQLMNESTMVGTPVAGTGSALSFGDQTDEGIYSVEATSTAGCSSTMSGIAIVNVGTPSTADTTAVACDSLVWNNSTYYTSGNYDFHTTNASGCDSTITLHLTINTSISITSVSAANNSLCLGNNTDLTANGVSGTNAVVNWFSGPGGTGSNLGNGNTLLNVGPGTYYARVTGDCGSPLEDSIIVFSDTTRPTITCTGDSTIPTLTTSCTRAVAFDNTSYADNCGVTALKWELTGATVAKSASFGINQLPVRTYNKGVTTITLTAVDARGNTQSCSYNLTVVDNVLPLFTFRNTATIKANILSGCTSDATIPDATYTDNCGTPTLSWAMTGATIDNGTGQIGTKTFNRGTTVVTYTITDDAANFRTSSFNVIIKDTIVPLITCPGDTTVTTRAATCQKGFKVAGIPTYSDNCEIPTLTWKLTGATTSQSAGTGINLLPYRTYNKGTTVVTYTVKDASGIVGTCSFNVNVIGEGSCSSRNDAIVANKNPFDNEVIDAVLKAKLSPNPTKTSFLLQVQSDKKDVVEINVYKRDGKRIQTVKSLPYQMLNIGANYSNGLYMFEILQGERRTTITGVKQ